MLTLEWRSVRNDIVAGITVALVAFPLALAFGIASGAGPAAGLYAAIFGGLVASLFGGSPVQVSGPTGAMTVVLLATITNHGIETMLVAAVLAGILQIILGLVRVGGFVQFLPYPVMAGFTSGVGIVILLGQLDSAGTAPIIAIATALAMFVAIRFAKGLPASLVGLIVGVLVNEFWVHTPHLVSGVPSGLPSLAIPGFSMQTLIHAMGPAITICLLSTMEGLLAATVADGITGQRHNSNRELIGQGLGNMASALVGGVPIGGAISRTVVNAKNGGRTRLSSLTHSAVLFLVVVALGGWATRLPLAALAAILIVTSIRMIDWESLAVVPKAPVQYTATLMVTLILTVVWDLAFAVGVGLLVKGFFVILSMTRPQILPGKPQSVEIESPPSGTVVYTVSGPLFFGVSKRLMEQLRGITDARTLILNMSHVPMIDTSGARMLHRAVTEMRKRGQEVFLVGLGSEPFRILLRMGIVEEFGRHYFCSNLHQAFSRAAVAAHATDVDAQVPQPVLEVSSTV